MLLIFLSFFWFKVKMPCLLRTQWSSLLVVPCVELNQSENAATKGCHIYKIYLQLTAKN